MSGQTLSEIRALLAGAGLVPQQQHGQNFLIDLNLMRKLVAGAELRAEDVVLEVGCGTGSLTEMMLESGARVVGVEIDRGLQRILRERLGEHPHFTLIQGDVLAGKHEISRLVLQALAEQQPGQRGHYKLVANLPYQVATPLLMELLHTTPPFERMCCTIQKEVGERLVADVGSAGYGPVSVVAQTLADVDLRAILPPTVFWPRPKVESVMLIIRPRPPERVEVADVRDFVDFVRRSFAHRRKMLRKALTGERAQDVDALFARIGISSDARPQAVSPAQWRALHEAVRPARRS